MYNQYGVNKSTVFTPPSLLDGNPPQVIGTARQCGSDIRWMARFSLTQHISFVPWLLCSLNMLAPLSQIMQLKIWTKSYLNVPCMCTAYTKDDTET